VDAFAGSELPGVPLIRSGSASADGEVLALREKIPVDFCFVIDFGQLIAEPILGWAERVGCLNIHPSLLPEYRGAAPIQRALMDCRAKTGVTVFKLAAGMDSGPILLRREISVKADDNAETLMGRAAITGASAFIEHASKYPADRWNFEAQDDAAATSAPKILPKEERIVWERSSHGICGLVRALAPKPGAWTTLRDKRLRILFADPLAADALGAEHRDAPGTICGARDGGVAVTTGDGGIILRDVQPEGKKIQRALDWWNGLRAASGERLS
jgi:methionyl-tRNA formyltransferase